MRSHNKRLLGALFAFLAIGMVFLAQTSPLWLKNAQGTPITICSVFGNKTIILDESGNEIPQLPVGVKSNCIMCLSAGASYVLPADISAQDIAPYGRITKLRWSVKNSPVLFAGYIPYRAIRAPPQYS